MLPAARVVCGDCREVMARLDPDSIDAIVTDPPYGLSFMGKDWDHGIPGEHFWREALRGAKPGAHLLAFGGTRTFHRLTCAIEDAGWEIRDCIMWVYGSGFPKSLDVSKAIDKAAGADREKKWKRYTANTMAGAYDQRPWLDEARKNGGRMIDTNKPATLAARQWSGWGTALKPAWEPIIVARKPLDGTVAENVLKHGTGAINIDGCRVGDNAGWSYPNGRGGSGWHGLDSLANNLTEPMAATQGRWPANLIHDGSEEVVGLFPSNCPGMASQVDTKETPSNYFGLTKHPGIRNGRGDTGSAARFFYCAKASKADRDEGCEGMARVRVGSEIQGTDAHSERTGNLTAPAHNHHPTVKPTALMRYLCRLVTPPGGLVLDPFCGSGSTGKAALLEGFSFLGIDISAEYCEIARARIAHVSPAPLEEEDKVNKDGSGQLRLAF